MLGDKLRASGWEFWFVGLEGAAQRRNDSTFYRSFLDHYQPISTFFFVVAFFFFKATRFVQCPCFVFTRSNVTRAHEGSSNLLINTAWTKWWVCHLSSDPYFCVYVNMKITFQPVSLLVIRTLTLSREEVSKGVINKESKLSFGNVWSVLGREGKKREHTFPIFSFWLNSDEAEQKVCSKD